jgi:NADH:ubiquinone oxidoreductase subunit D
MELSSPAPYNDSTIVIPKRAPEVTTIVIETPRSNMDRIMDLVTLLLGIGNLTVVYFQLKDRKRKND